MVALLGGSLQMAVTAAAQTTTGSIYGTVADSTGAVIPNVKVTATNAGTAISTTVSSNGSGEYVFPALDPGTYRVSATMSGFKVETQRGISLSANENAHANFTLVAGATSDTVTVDAETTLVDTRESQLAETVDQRRIEELPLNGRNVYDLVTLMPGVTNYSSDTPTGSRTGVNLSVNGLPTNTVSYYLDGTSDTAFYQDGGDDLPNPDSLQEFRLLTSNFDAEFGRSPGGIVNVITRSGTRTFHGMAYEYLRNNIFNASGYFAPNTTSLKQNQFGGNFGGPMLRGGRAFIFLSYEKYLIHTPATVQPGEITTATALERDGNFSQSTSKPTTLPAGTNCGTTAAPVICTGSLDPVAQNLLKFVPVEVNGTNAQQSSNGNTTNNEGLGRIDYKLSPAHQIEALFYNSRGINNAPKIGANRILNYAGMSNYENQVNTALEDTWTMSTRTLNSLRGFYTQNRYIIGDLFPNDVLPNLGSQAPEGGAISASPDFAITGYWTMGTNQNGPSDISQLSFGLIDTANLTRGHHEIKIGGSYVRNKYAETGGLQSNGIFTFTGGTTGNALADFLLGRANSLVQTTIVIHRNHDYSPALFLQDDWQIRPRLSLNLGARWEVFPPFVGDPNLGTFSAGQQSKVFPTAPLGLLYEGDPNVPQGIYHTSYKRIAPRVGFAYDIFGNGKTSLRGGYGIFYYLPKEPDTGNLAQQPYNLSVTTNKIPNLVTPYAPGVDPFPFTFDPAHPKFVTGATIASAPLDGSTAYVMEYNLTLEQQLGSQWAFRLGYVGNGARKISLSHDINAPTYVPGAATTTAAINARRPNEPTAGAFGAINLNDPANDFSYNSLQTTLRGRIGAYLNVQAFYVWSKAMSYEGPVVSGRNLALDRGLASTHLGNNFATSVLYSFPNVKRLGLAGGEVLSGWQLNSLVQWHSGSPFTVISGTDTNLDGTVNDRADIVGNPYTGASSHANMRYHFLNPAAFALPSGPFGDEQNDSMIGPRFFNTNASVFKNFGIYERLHLQFRAEAFNVFNNVNFGNPAANWVTLKQEAAAAPGTTASQQISTQTGNARVMQFALKLIF
jgi:hypothetical protein